MGKLVDKGSSPAPSEIISVAHGHHSRALMLHFIHNEECRSALEICFIVSSETGGVELKRHKRSCR